MDIVSLKEKILSVKKELHKYQSGKFKPVKTGREWLDSMFGGLIPGDIVVIAGSSGGGKSFELSRVKRYIMDLNNNDSANDFVWLSNSLEMRLLSNVLRDLSVKLNKGKGKILKENFNEDELNIAKEYFSDLEDGRFYLNEKSSTSNEFSNQIRFFLDNNKDKKAVFIDIDHIALQKGGDDKKGVVDAVMEEIISINKDYKNVFWIVLSQLNRQILLRSKDKDSNSAPNRGDLYQSDTIFHAADYVYVTHNPQRLGILEYMRVSQDAYMYLADHFSEIKGNRCSFKTFSRIFYHVLKNREANALFKDIYIEEINFEGKDNFKGLEDKPSENKIDIEKDMPNFNSKSMNKWYEKDNAFDEIDDVPF